MKIEFPVHDYDCAAFVAETVRGRQGQYESDCGPQSEFFVVDAEGYVDEDLTFRENRDPAAELEDGRILFAPFAGPNVEGSVTAVDGKQYGSTEYSEDEDSEQEDLGLAEDLTLGFLVRVRGERVRFETAEMFHGMCIPPLPPRADVRPNAGVFEEGMREFLSRFAGRESRR